MSMQFDFEEWGRVIDQMTPKLRAEMPMTATEYGNRLFGCYLAGIANILKNDEVDWAAMAASPASRHACAAEIQRASVLAYNGIKET